MKTLHSKILALALLLFCGTQAYANDGVYYTSGNQLIPLQETSISVQKEVLTISLCDNGWAKVDVYYEFMNNSTQKTVVMGFEADAPYNAWSGFSHKGIHPFIKDFSVEMNGTNLPYSNAVCLNDIAKNGLKPFDLNAWKSPEEDKVANSHADDDQLYNARLDSTSRFSYVYKFNATFRPGKNIVHHTYRYQMSNGVGMTFKVDYKLTPAARWAGNSIGDFTLRIKAENTAKHFCINNKTFKGAQWQVTEGKGKVRTSLKYDTQTEIALRNGTIEWSKKNFTPTDEVDIISADLVCGYQEPFLLGEFYDRSDTYNPFALYYEMMQNPGADKLRILRNLPYANRGYVFKDKNLQNYFNKIWWYMPDPTWQTSTKDFTPSEQRFITGKITKD